MSVAYWLNTFWAAKCRSAARKFAAATQKVAVAQAQLLAITLRRNQETQFGQAHQFAELDSVEKYRQAVPLRTYDDMSDWIAQIAEGQQQVLTDQRVELLQPTSGSSGGRKLIPYTAELRRQFQRAIDPWIHDLFSHCPSIRSGRAYWSVSPCLETREITSGGLAVGFDDDVAYLSRWEQWAVRRLLVAPTSLAQVSHMDNFRYAALLHLLAAPDLTLISVWSPTFLTALMAPLGQWIQRMCHDLRRGTISWPVSTSAGQSPLQLRRAPARAAQLAHLWAQQRTVAEFLAEVWPQLQLISCWCDAAAAQYVSALRELLPHAPIQPKGLLATEACVSVPLWDEPGAALAVRSHFFEFLEGDAVGPPQPHAHTRLAHELERGGRYRVVVTTGGGLYRYCFGDLVEVVGFRHQCPLLRFLGRVDQVSDLTGEKLSEQHVQEVVRRALSAMGVSTGFAMLVPVTRPQPQYRLLLQSPDQLDSAACAAVVAGVEQGLSENPYYRHARRAKQLGPLTVQLLTGPPITYWRAYEAHCLARGQKAGDIKPAVLAPADWTCEAR